MRRPIGAYKERFEHHAISDLEALSLRMWNQTPVSTAEVRELSRERIRAIWPKVVSGQTYDEADGGVLAFLTTPDAQEHLRKIEHDLEAQVKIVDGMFDEYLAYGKVPSPHFAMRIAVLLSTSGYMRHEMAFLAGWCKHFGEAQSNSVYTELAERARSLRMYR